MKRILIAMVAMMALLPASGWARNFTAAFKGESPTAAIALLKKTTGYDFVYQKNLVKDLHAKVTGEFKDVTLEQLLDGTVGMQLGLDYKIVDKTVTLRPSDRKVSKTTEVKGIVVDNEGEPLPGATIQLKGTTFGIATDADGMFTLELGPGRHELEIRYVGMEPKSVSILPTRQGQLRIELVPNEALMGEVVVTGYQNIKKENVTGAFTMVKAEDLEKRHSSNIAETLEGTIPGMTVSHNDSPRANSLGNEENKFVIRGVGTFEAGSAPLVVVDGLPIEGGLQTVNMYDINTVTVLKDAAAAAIYGARASNGVIVITTKTAQKQKLKVDFNVDLTLRDKIDYSKAGWATGAQLIDLERRNWKALLAQEGQADLGSLMADWQSGRSIPSPITDLFLQNYTGSLSEADMESRIAAFAGNDYRREWQDLRERTGVLQQYNVAIRTQGSVLSSNVTANYTRDNQGRAGEYDSQLSFRYKGDLKAAKWLDLSFSFNILNQRTKTGVYDAAYELSDINSYRPYETLYNADGSRKRMLGTVNLNNPAFAVADYELKDHTFNMADEMGKSTQRQRYTNIRSYINALVRLPIEGWTATAMFQYEDINQSSRVQYGGDSYYLRDLYNRCTTYEETQTWVEDYANFDWETWDGDWDHYGKVLKTMPVLKHNMPDGDVLQTTNQHSAFYTFRVQTDYSHRFADKHDVNVLAGFEYRDNHSSYDSDVFLGYDPTTLTNQNVKADWEFLTGFGRSGVLGPSYTANPYFGFGSGDTLHRYYSWYFTGNYMYDSRYSVFGSYRVDRTDLFGSDPKFRGRPLWSVGLSWNLNNEAFMRGIELINMLKVRGSYGLTGHIAADAKSILTASIRNNDLNGKPEGTVATPPNDQLRWEKTATWNFGLDFSLFDFRLNGSFDYYHKSGTDLLTNVELDCTTGWFKQKLNAGEMTNRGVELQLNGVAVEQLSRDRFGLNLGASFGYNRNKVTKVHVKPVTGNDFRTATLKEGYPMNAIMAIDFAGYQEIDGMTYGTWRGHDGEEHTTQLSNSSFTQDDCIYVGTRTPKWHGGLNIEPKWYGFSLNANFNFYGGHYMNCDPQIYDLYYGGAGGYAGATPANALDYWNGNERAIPNGYMSKYVDRYTYGMGASDYRNYERADYLKLRSLTLSYDFTRGLCRRIGLQDLRLRVQMNNVFTWARNSRGWDPEGYTLSNSQMMSAPKSYSFSLFFSL